MRFLLDENVPNMYMKLLKNKGYKDIIRINDFGKGLPDTEVFKIAQKEKRAIITIDRDFDEYKKQESCGIISISGKLINPIEVMTIVLHQIEKDERLPSDLFNSFVRITNQEFYIIYKKKNKYNTAKCKFKKIPKNTCNW